jgi:radical SAM superfamily enzyme
VIVERVSGDAPPDYLIEPQWCLDKARLRKDIENELARLDAYQGDLGALEATLGKKQEQLSNHPRITS